MALVNKLLILIQQNVTWIKAEGTFWGWTTENAVTNKILYYKKEEIYGALMMALIKTAEEDKKLTTDLKILNGLVLICKQQLLLITVLNTQEIKSRIYLITLGCLPFVLQQLINPKDLSWNL